MNDTTPNPTIVVIIQVACDPASSGYSQLTQAVHAAVRASLDAQAALPATPVALADRTVTHTRHVGRTPQPRALGPTPPRPEPCCHDPRCDRNLLCLLLSPDSIRMIARRFFWRRWIRTGWSSCGTRNRSSFRNGARPSETLARPPLLRMKRGSPSAKAYGLMKPASGAQPARHGSRGFTGTVESGIIRDGFTAISATPRRF